jgi:RNA polymerase sigma factor (TIGR02999 family)
LLPLVYEQLRQLAAQKMAQQPAGQTLQATALVHEVWLKLQGGAKDQWANRKHFFSAAAEAMRHILIDRARQRRALRHGGGQQRINVEDIEIADDTQDEETLLAVSDAVDKLGHEHPQMAQFVKLRCFAGLEITQAALAMGISRSTANRWWLFARTWLYRELHA